jgi:hypothetical protein
MWYGIDQIATLSQQLLWAVGLQITFIVLNLILSAKFVQHLRNPWTTAKFQSAHAAGLGSFQPSTDPVSACGSMHAAASEGGRSVGRRIPDFIFELASRSRFAPLQNCNHSCCATVAIGEAILKKIDLSPKIDLPYLAVTIRDFFLNHAVRRRDVCS